MRTASPGARAKGRWACMLGGARPWAEAKDLSEDAQICPNIREKRLAT
ncbi:hypothetical protein CGMCC3_g2987 [Colletotrichum fructicola]|nr:uncharacterized protein CGMCC3_g2987 [Colletotrichum fructicola]KAE9580888.1 hypothetical protein CGMCC3_g2987 [Colletotrichum fructicola]